MAYEEIKILREDLLREGETMNKNKSHFLSPVDNEEIRRLEQQELTFSRGSASKRLAGWTRDGIAGWMMEAQRLNKEVEAKKRKLQETIERDSRKDARMTMPWMVWMVLCRHEGAYTKKNNTRKIKNSGLSNAVTDSVSLKVLSWNVAVLAAEDCTDIFLSQISMLAGWDVLLLQECFRKLDGLNVGAHELFTPSELLGGLRCPAVIVNRKWKGQSKIVGGAARWTAVELDGQLTLISVHFPQKGRKLGEFEAALMEIQENVRPKQHVFLGGDFNVSLFGMTDYLHVGESIPRPRTLVDTNDSLRARAFTDDGDRAGFDGDKTRG